MSLIKLKNTPTYRWNASDLISPLEACRLLGYKCARQLKDKTRRRHVAKNFEAAGCTLTLGIEILGKPKFLRSEIDLYISKKVEAAQNGAGS